MKTKRIIILLSFIAFFGCQNNQLTEEKADNELATEQILNEEKKGEEKDFVLTKLSGDCFPVVGDKYNYPIVPGMIEWQTANSTDEIMKFQQLPEDVLVSISTTGLVDALLFAPTFTSFYHLSNDATALKWHKQYELFNSAIELFKRKNAGDALVAYYKLVSFDCCDPIIVNETYMRIVGLECLFTKNDILDNMTHELKKEAIAALLANYEIRQDDSQNSIFPMTYILYADKFEPLVKYANENEKEFQCLYNGYFDDIEEQVDLIISFAKNFINI